MNNIIVGMGEALWDVFHEGKKIVVLRLISLIMFHSLVFDSV